MTINIHGKEYVEVKDRVLQFRKNNESWALVTEIVYQNEDTGSIIFKATVMDENNRVVSTGHAHEFKDDKSSMVNSTSHVENCETSAIGRALASLGYGIEESFASAKEMEIVERKKTRTPKDQPAIENKDENHWSNAIVPIGKHKGKRFGNLAERSRQWFIENFEPNDQYEDSVAFRRACDECNEEVYGAPTPKNLPEPLPEEAERFEDEEDVPF